MKKEEITINNSGKIYLHDNLNMGTGIINTRKFIKAIFKSFARDSSKYYDVVGELPFIYRELQLHSIILPAISKNADACLIEQPVYKNINGKQCRGRIDYWVLFGSTVLLIELKHGWISGNSKKLNNSIKEKWEKVIEQINSISTQEAQNLCTKGLNVVKIALIVCPIYFSSKIKQNIIECETEEGFVLSLFDERFEANIKPNYIGHWKLHKRIADDVFEYKESFEKYTDIVISAYIENLGCA